MDYYAYVLERLRDEDFRRLRSYQTEPSCKFSTWLTVVVRRLCVDRHRQRYGRLHAEPGGTGDLARRNLLHLVAERLETVDPADPTPAANPEASLRQRELIGALQRELEQLAPRDRYLLALRFEDDLGAEEIAGMLGFATRFHVYRSINRVLLELRRRLSGRGIQGSIA